MSQNEHEGKYIFCSFHTGVWFLRGIKLLAWDKKCRNSEKNRIFIFRALKWLYLMGWNLAFKFILINFTFLQSSNLLARTILPEQISTSPKFLCVLKQFLFSPEIFVDIILLKYNCEAAHGYYYIIIDCKKKGESFKTRYPLSKCWRFGNFRKRFVLTSCNLTEIINTKFSL